MRVSASSAMIVLAFSASGCGGVTDGSYALENGSATYDGLRAATEQCQAKGGHIHLRKEYGGQNLSDYDCVTSRTR
jgi:hypothetical protein